MLQKTVVACVILSYKSHVLSSNSAFELHFQEKDEKFLLFDEDTALIVQVSSPGGAYSKLLDILLAKNEGQIKRCLFVTQTHQMAVRRNSIKNPGTDKDGHRVYFSLAVETIGNYSESFLDIPIGILGVDAK